MASDYLTVMSFIVLLATKLLSSLCYTTGPFNMQTKAVDIMIHGFIFCHNGRRPWL